MENMTAPFAPMIREMPKIPAPTCYLDHDDLTLEERGLRYAEMLREEILRQGPETVLGFIMEPVGGASTGALVAPDSYYARVAEICREFGILLILDEVMTGAGRTGRFLAAEHWGLAPDIIALSKGFAAGYAPLGAMVAHEKLVEPVLSRGGFVHGYTYAGNPLACAAGLAVLEEIERADLCARAETMGDKLKRELTGLKARYPFIGDVRGKGLLLAFELVSDKKTMEPLPREIDAHIHLVEEAYSRGLIIYSRRTRGGLEGDHFMVCPPLIVEDEHIAEIMDKLTASLDAFADRFDLPKGNS
jgi:adenosylmethionine-8-amino-7-oxononanoate aminotransferase